VQYIPILGIVAFSLCSTWALFNLFHGAALHPTPLYWLPAVLVELVTAGIVSQIVSVVRSLTKSNISKQDRRFFRVIVLWLLVVALPLLSLSVSANALEFRNVLLGVVFPLASIGCAVLAAIPGSLEKFEQQRAQERKEQDEERKEKERERQHEADLQQKLGRAAAVYALYRNNPTLTQANAGEKLGVSRQTVSYHLSKLAEEGLMRANGNGWEVVEMEEHNGFR